MSRIGVIGLGYVGAVTAACLARDGHDVIAVDRDLDKVSRVGQGIAPLWEPGLDALLRDAVAAGRLRTTTDIREAIFQTEAAIVAVGTPTGRDNQPDLTAVRAVSDQIGAALAGCPQPYTVIMRSTVPPGTQR